MKKLIFVLCICLVFGVYGCSYKNEDKQQARITVQKQTNKEAENNNASGGQNKEQDIISNNKQHKNIKKVVVYFFDDSGKFSKRIVESSDVNEKFLWKQLQDSGMISSEAQINFMRIEGQGVMQLDVNTKFGEQFRSYGTAGEEELLKCVVNSYLDTFSCKKVRITENGNILTSSHKEYDSYIKRME